MTRLRIGTRGSALARAQAAQVAAMLRERRPDADFEVVVITVSGDAGQPAGAGGPADKTRWVDAIEDALRDRAIDLAVHSAKDVPGRLPDGLGLLGAPAREDPRDALCGAPSLDALAAGARVGTGSIRRTAQLKALREDLEVVDLRGNVDTRLRRLAEGGYDAIVLALAGLRRLGRAAEAGAELDVQQFVPAPGQGTLALEGRVEDPEARHAAEAISHAGTVAALAAERALVATLDASCHTPLGAHARVDDGGRLELSAFAGLPDGSAWVRDRVVGELAGPGELGRRAGERMLVAGAGELLRQAEEMVVGRV
jgi:hydroxymethylbilane synthase